MSRALVPLALIALSACAPATSSDDDTDTRDTDTTVDSDSDTTVDTEDTDPGDTQIDTDTDASGSVTIPDLRLGAAGKVVGDVVQVDGVVVTGVRQDGTGFVVQDRAATGYGGIFVAVEDGTSLPTTGQLVTIVGQYQETGGGSVPLQTRATLVVSTSVDGSRIQVTGTAPNPSPLPQVYATNFFGHGEQYESMLVRITAASQGRLVVSAGADDDGSFEIEPPPTGASRLKIGAWFVDPSAGLADLGAGASFAAIRGIVEPDGGLSLQPIGGADLTDYQPGDGTTDTDTDTDTDPGTGDTLIETGLPDTFQGADTDTGGGSAAQFAELTPAQVHAGIATADVTFVTCKGVVVTAVVDGSAAKDHFVVQSTSGTSDAGLWIFANDTQAAGLTLPAVGDIVDVTGQYQEFSIPHGSPGTSSQSRLVVNSTALPPGWSTTGWTVKSHGNPLPTPVDVTPATFADLHAMEPYESMRVRVFESGQDITVFTSSGATVKLGTTTSSARVQLDAFFYDVKSTYTMSVGARMDSITGIYYAKYPVSPPNVAMRLAPTSSADVVNYH